MTTIIHYRLASSARMAPRSGAMAVHASRSPASSWTTPHNREDGAAGVVIGAAIYSAAAAAGSM
jgi:hypothetical protein